MKDAGLNQNLYESIVKLCKVNSIAKIYNLKITVHKESHISEESIRDVFCNKNSILIGRITDIAVEYGDVDPCKFKIDHIDGAKNS